MKMQPTSMQRRSWLARLAAAGGAGVALALPASRLALAAAAASHGDAGRLVIVMLRGALDGLAAVPPVGDPAWPSLRPHAGAGQERFGAPLPLDGMFALHPALAALHRWYLAGQLLVVHATASPYRERSHFDAQQLLESGGSRPFELQTGWLGRALQAGQHSGLALSPALPLALRGASGASSWAPSRATPADADFMARVAQLYEADPPLAAMLARAMAQRGSRTGEAAPGHGFVDLARHAGAFLAAPGGPQVAWLESGGWDTHTRQAPRLAQLLQTLDEGLVALRVALGERWSSTTLLVITEFGRSAAMNGSGGSDHGTAGIALVAGGGVAGGRVLADWPGLAPGQLFEGRDLRPTLDLRAIIKPALQRHLRVATVQLEREVLPGAPRGRSDLWRA